MRRVYTSTAYFRAPYQPGGLTLTGLGASWPPGRSYQDVSNYRAPYDSGYFQSNALFGLGGVRQIPESELRLMPPKVQRFLRSGEPVGTVRRDMGAASAQIPRLVWGLCGGVALLLGYYSYKRFKRTQRAAQMTANRKRRYRKNMRKYTSEKDAAQYARAAKQYYGWSVFSEGWYVGTKEQLKKIGVTKPVSLYVEK